MATYPFSQELVRRLARASRAAVLTGAGISAESGVPTFRDPEGLWEKFEPQELANAEAFLKNTELVQAWYAHRRKLVTETRPNPGHEALTDLETIVPAFTVITQNVDNLHQRAGSQEIVELHGNLMRNYCMGCGGEASDIDMTALKGGKPVVCEDCGGFIRPDVVWFGEMLPEGAMESAHEAASQAEVFLSIGTSAVVYPAAGLPVAAKEQGAYVAEINVKRSALSDAVDEVVLGKAGEVLPQLVEAVRRCAPAAP